MALEMTRDNVTKLSAAAGLFIAAIIVLWFTVLSKPKVKEFEGASAPAQERAGNTRGPTDDY